MLFTWILPFFAFVACIVSATPLTGAENQLLGTSLMPNVSQYSSANRSMTPGILSTENALNIKCDGAQYGANLDIADCKDAKAYISSGSEQHPWADRYIRWRKPHFILPYRFMGGKNERSSRSIRAFY